MQRQFSPRFIRLTANRLTTIRRKILGTLTALLLATGIGAVPVTVLLLQPTSAEALENGLARTPPMGFNNWNTTHCNSTFNETTIRGVADSFVSLGLKSAGYKYVNIDDCWAEPARDSSGNLVPNHTRFPSGIKALADYVHSKGLKFGIYTSAGTKTCNGTGGFPGGLNNEQRDANLFASWGVDYLKYDNCNNQGVDAQQRYKAMRDALAATGRPIVFSICEWGSSTPKVWTWGADVGNLWRTTGDISDNWSSMISRVHTNDDLAQYAGPGHWNDPDMLEVGNGGMTTTEYRTHFSLWSMMAAPLLIGSDIRSDSTTDLDILKNTDVIAVDQDSLGKQATIVSSSGGLVVYSKVLANGDRAVALLNENSSTATVSTTASAVGLSGSSSYTLKDLWSKASRTTSGAISASVPSHGTVVYRVSRGGTAVSSYEAEDGTLGGAAASTTCATCSGGAKVRFIGNAAANTVTFTVPSSSAGSKTLTLDYLLSGTRSFFVSVDGGTAVEHSYTGSSWSAPASATISVTLKSGTNTIVFSNPSAYAPDLDRITI
jgi:alpha-galactosidase